MNQQFPSFHLEDKVNVEPRGIVRPPILHTYKRKGRMVGFILEDITLSRAVAVAEGHPRIGCKVASASQVPRVESKVEGGDTSTKETRNEEQMKKIGRQELRFMFFLDRTEFPKCKLTDSAKLIDAVIRFDGTTLDWSRSKEERNAFKHWLELKQRLLIRFRAVKEEPICRRFLASNRKQSWKVNKNYWREPKRRLE
uniref:Uncharacterized protein n=1 Tax=Cucumis melo TaxID=3656 RepID=A0A9I9EES2_CUCME